MDPISFILGRRSKGGSGGGGGQGGGGGAIDADVRFFDYDGSIVASYSAQEFASLSALPDNPVHDGLTSQGWNWTLSDAKTHVAASGFLDIGQMYITSDGKTRLYIHLDAGRLAPYCGFGVNGEADIDWGDGSEHDTLTDTSSFMIKKVQHTYSAPGDYVIAITVISGSILLKTNNSSASSLLFKNAASGYYDEDKVYVSAIRRVEIGADCQIGVNAFRFASGLQSVTLPKNISIEASAFSYCGSLRHINIPNGVSALPDHFFYYGYSLESVSLPSGVTSIGASAFVRCYSLTRVCIPNTVTSLGDYVFNFSCSLSKVNIPSSLSSCGVYAFSSTNIKLVVLPKSLTSIPTYMFNGAPLKSVQLGEDLTNIGNSAFSSCDCLSVITIPANVTSIGKEAFKSACGLSEIHFKPTNPPTAGSGAFASLPKDCTIYVPTGSLSAYTSAQYYPSSSTYTYVEES